MPEDTILYVLRDNDGKWLATPDETEARAFLPAFEEQTMIVLTLKELYERDPHALVRARQQYYWAEDLLRGMARGALN